MLYSIKKLEYSKEIVDKFLNEYAIFIQENYKVIRETTDDNKTIARLRIQNQIPDGWGLVIGDILHNLRSSLDLLISDLLIANGKLPNEVSCFPINKTEEVFLTHGLSKVEGISSSAIEIIKGIKPYEKSNPLLWELHRLDNIQKHRIIIPIISENKAVIFNFGEQMRQMIDDEELRTIPFPSIGIRPADRKIEDGTVVFTAEDNFWSRATEYPKFEFELVFGENELLEGESISAKLNEYVQLIENIITKFEEELK